MSKGDTLFALTEWVEPQRRQLFDELGRRQHLRGLDRDGFGTVAGQFLSDLNALHPSGKATAAPNASSSSCSPTRPAGNSPGPASTRRKRTPPARAMSDRNAFRPLLDRILLAADEAVPEDGLSLRHEAEEPTVKDDPRQDAAGQAARAYAKEARPVPPTSDERHTRPG